MKTIGIAAIALTLIIVCPIILGYGLASEDVEHTVESEKDAKSITDLLLNSESDYYIDYTKTNNNSLILQKVTAQGGSEYIYTTPDYVDVSETYSSIPKYITTTHNSFINPDSTETSFSYTEHTMPYVNGVILGSRTALTEEWAAGYNTMIVNAVFDNASRYVYDFELTGNGQYLPYLWVQSSVANYSAPISTSNGGIQTGSVRMIYNGDDADYAWTFVVGTDSYQSNWAVLGSVSTSSLTATHYGFQDISTSSTSWNLNMSNDTAIAELTYTDSTVYTTFSTMSLTPNFLMVGETVMDTPTAISISNPSIATLATYSQTLSGEYADPSAGWYNAEPLYPTHYNAWENEFQNKSVEFYVSFSGEGQTVFSEGFGTTDTIITIARHDDTIYLIYPNESDVIIELGRYPIVQVIFDAVEEQVTINGIKTMPTMGATPTTYNSDTFWYDFGGYIERIGITDSYSSTSIGYDADADYHVKREHYVYLTSTIQGLPMRECTLTDSDGNEVPTSRGWSVSQDNYGFLFYASDSLPLDTYTFTSTFLQNSGTFECTVNVYISSTTTDPISYRVDKASVVAGQYPSTKDYALRLWDLYPDSEHERIYFNTIGVYGDYFTIGGVQRTILNGQIALTDADTGEGFLASLLGMRIDMIDSEEWGEYVTYVNGHRIANSDSAPEIVFVGEWSLTATRCNVVEDTILKSEWVPGEFVLDKDGFVLAMVITAVAAFVVLGMSGARSGAKVGLLALICGGACAVGFLIL